MAEPTTSALDPDQLCLAQLACAKLARLVQGALSIGLPALVTDVPDPRIFLEEQFRVMTGFAIVLHTVSGKPESQDEMLRLRHQAREVMRSVENLRYRLLEQLGSPSLELLAARDAASALCDAISEYAHLVQLDSLRITKVKVVVLQVFEGMTSLTTFQESSAG